MKGDPEIAKFQFRARNQWQGGTHSRSEYSRLLRRHAGAAAQERHRRRERPPGGARRRRPRPDPRRVPPARDRGCLTSGIANIAAARGVTLTQVSSTVEGDIDLLGILGLSDHVRNGYQQLKVTFHVEGDADDATLRAIVEQSRRRSAVYDALTNPTPVQIEVVTG